jgi:hypothetical protein
LLEGCNERGEIAKKGEQKMQKGSTNNLLNREEGFITIPLLTIMFVIIFAVFAVLSGVAFGARKTAVATYQWFGEAMDFAAYAANREGVINNTSINADKGRKYFEVAFARMTNTTLRGSSFYPQGASPYPGPIVLNSFTLVLPGMPVPYGIAREPGFMATISVPVWGGNLPFVGTQYLSVPMRYFAPVKTTQLHF